MKLSAIVSIFAMCFLIVLGSIYVIIKDVNLLFSDNVISYGQLAFFHSLVLKEGRLCDSLF